MESERESIGYEVSAFIFVGGYHCIPPREISKHLGLEPERTSDTPLKRGAERPPGWQTWFYNSEESGKDRVTSIEACVRELLTNILPHKERFASLPGDCEKELVVTAFTDDLRPNLELSPDIMKLLGSFGLSLRVALYCGPDEDDEDIEN